jgi:hypothetical protein
VVLFFKKGLLALDQAKSGRIGIMSRALAMYGWRDRDDFCLTFMTWRQVMDQAPVGKIEGRLPYVVGAVEAIREVAPDTPFGLPLDSLILDTVARSADGPLAGGLRTSQPPR